MTQAMQELGALITAKRPDCVLAYNVSFDELNIDVAPSNIVGLIEFLKSNRSCRFSSLVDITAVDYPGHEKRFEVVYHLLSMYQNTVCACVCWCLRTTWLRQSLKCTHQPIGLSAKFLICSAFCLPVTLICGVY